MKFAHMGDCHLGGWRVPELRELNFKHFKEAVNRCIKEKVDFILISGDLFDSAYPPIEILKKTFEEFRKIKEANIPVFLIAGSHDYSVSGKTFLDVLEKAGFCKNVGIYEEKEGKIILEPVIYKNVIIYGYPGKKSGLEVEEIEKIKIQQSPLFKILMLHTAIRDAVQNPAINAVDEKYLPKVDYLALSHLHINYNREGRVYSGPIFPNNISELDELKEGSFYIFDNGKIRRERISLKEVISIHLETNNSLTATENILEMLSKENVKDKIVIIKVSGVMEKGKVSDIDFYKIENYLKELGAFAFLKSTSKLHVVEPEIKIDIVDSENFENEIIKKFEQNGKSRFSCLVPDLMGVLKIEKLEDETLSSFEDRLMSEINIMFKNEI
ncbi:DNA repair exonuclease [Candidatus Pacearchaeota archaeon]|nr:DNA repair exonuclease [Candidatus Pacearchaeota archaeon]